MTDPAKQSERLRLAALGNYKVLDTPREAPFDRIARLAAAALRAPIAQIGFVDRERQWLKASEGLDLGEIPRGQSFGGYAVQSDEPLVVPDARADTRFRDLPLVVAPPHVRSYVGVPLRTPMGLRIGVLCVMHTVVRKWSVDDVAILRDLAHLVMDELELRLVATSDSLTGALSRLAFIKVAARDIEKVRRKPCDLSCILLDIDHFKAVNDSHGHAVGDRVLQELVIMLRADLRGDDYVGRLGGEEFAIVMPGAGRSAAREIGERLRRRVMDAAFGVPGGETKLTVSLGVATLKHADAGIEDLLRRADDALYAAKTSGRNRLVSDEPAPLELVVR